MDTLVTTSDAARIIGCHDSRVRQLLRDGLLAGRRAGRDWLVDRAAAERYAANRPKPGRKPKAAADA